MIGQAFCRRGHLTSYLKEVKPSRGGDVGGGFPSPRDSNRRGAQS